MESALNPLMAPPWIFPEAEPCTLENPSEGYASEFKQWFKALNETEAASFKKMFPQPAPWPSFYDGPHGLPMDMRGVAQWTPGGEAKYTRQALVNTLGGRELADITCFWKPQPKVNSSCLGQWQPSIFKVNGRVYTCAEQYMMAEKARIFEDEEMLAKIMASKSPKNMKALGRKVKSYDDAVWDKVKHSVALNGNWLKFTQNEKMKEYLLKTGDSVLIEASPFDKIWGVGMSEMDPLIKNPALWNGCNLLGFALMEVRDELMKVFKNCGRLPATINCEASERSEKP
ncbi:MAG: NADAR family protein [Clostridiales bacterium]|jgi:ribA/ribD-fused uncharacterized protein|nr:NADAR family protein [Clostridiales bacterium]